MTSMPIDLAEFDTDLEMTSAESEPSDESLLRQFSVHGDAGAFEQLVVRHGPMVLGVCRRMLRDSHAADDAFQATFLVLVRRATSLRQPELLGNWLYGVAYRIAARARLQSVRRADHERRFPTMPATNQTQEVERREWQEVLDEDSPGGSLVVARCQRRDAGTIVRVAWCFLFFAQVASPHRTRECRVDAGTGDADTAVASYGFPNRFMASPPRDGVLACEPSTACLVQ